MLRHTGSGPLLRLLCARTSTAPSLRLDAATALGLMGDVDSIDTLVEGLTRAETLGATASMARALAFVGDARAVEPLLAIARDAHRASAIRGFACVALGLLCERGELPFNARIRAGNNYRASVPAMAEVLDIL